MDKLAHILGIIALVVLAGITLLIIWAYYNQVKADTMRASNILVSFVVNQTTYQVDRIGEQKTLSLAECYKVLKTAECNCQWIEDEVKFSVYEQKGWAIEVVWKVGRYRDMPKPSEYELPHLWLGEMLEYIDSLPAIKVAAA